MPVIKELNAGASGRIALWQVTETEAELQALLLPGTYDEQVLAGFVYAHRRIQWMATRLLLQHLVPGGSISYDAHGKPHLGQEGAKGFISLSHSGDLLAMVYDHSPTGIDIERIHPKIGRVAQKFLCDEEQARALDPPQPNRLHVYWCLKEATYKVYGRKGVSLKKNIFVEDFTYAPEGIAGCRLQHEETTLHCRLRYQSFDGFMLACVINE